MSAIQSTGPSAGAAGPETEGAQSRTYLERLLAVGKSLAPGTALLATLLALGAVGLSVAGVALEDVLVGATSLTGVGVASVGMLSPHEYGEIDIIDAVLSPAFVLSSTVATGIATFDIFGYSFSEPVISLSGGDITYATIISLVALAVAYTTNQIGFDDLDEFELGVVVVGFASTLGLALVPAYADLVTGSEAIGALIVVVHTVAYGILAYY